MSLWNWIKGWFASAPQPEAVVEQKRKDAAFLAYLESFIGVPYMWGGDFKRWKGGKDFGLDCSGFEQAAAAWQGIDQPGDQTAAGISNYYRSKGADYIGIGEEQCGDRVFYGSNASNPTHIVIVTAPGKIIGANGGGSKTTTKAIAKAQGACIKHDKIKYRKDLLFILRPKGMGWESK